jgi:hypothetical protein
MELFSRDHYATYYMRTFIAVVGRDNDTRVISGTPIDTESAFQLNAHDKLLALYLAHISGIDAEHLPIIRTNMVCMVCNKEANIRIHTSYLCSGCFNHIDNSRGAFIDDISGTAIAPLIEFSTACRAVCENTRFYAHYDGRGIFFHNYSYYNLESFGYVRESERYEIDICDNISLKCPIDESPDADKVYEFMFRRYLHTAMLISSLDIILDVVRIIWNILVRIELNVDGCYNGQSLYGVKNTMNFIGRNYNYTY